MLVGNLGTIKRCRLIKIIAETWRNKSIGRTLMNLEVQKHVELSGVVLDLGGGSNPSYWRFIDKRDSMVKVIKIDIVSEYSPHIIASLEKELPIKSNSVDCVLLFNVLEHIYAHHRLVKEIHRVLKNYGEFYCTVPLMWHIHADPYDYYRYTKNALENILTESGFKDFKIVAYGGLFLVIANLMNLVLRIRILKVMTSLSCLLLNTILTKVVGKNRNEERYVLGYFISGVADK
jgi:SAM-dependent methyltransferase